MIIKFYQSNDSMNEDWDAILNTPLLVLRDVESDQIPSLDEYIILPVGTFMYRVTKIIRRIDEIKPTIYQTVTIDVVLTSAIID